MTQPPAPTDLNWAALLDLAARLGVRVWRLDDTGQLAPVHDATDSPGTNPTTGSQEGEPSCLTP